MPWGLIAAIATIAGAATTTAVTIDQALNQPSAPQIPTAPATPGPQTQATNLAQRASVAAAAPNEQSLTGNSLSPEYFAQWAGLNTGLGNNPQAAGNTQAAINQFFGFAAPGTTGLSSTAPTGNSITDLLSRAGTTSGTPAGGGGAGGGSFIDSLLQSDAFRGFS